MAAAALATSRGVAVSSSFKGLFLIFTLLCLVCLSSSLINKEELKQLRENYQKAQEKVDRLKADYEEGVSFPSELLTEYVNLMDPMITLVKKTVKSSPDNDFPPLDIYMENVKNYVMKTKAYIDRKKKELGENIGETEKKLGQWKTFIESFEEQQAEL